MASTRAEFGGSQWTIFDGAPLYAASCVYDATTNTLAAPTLVSPAVDARLSAGQSITFDWGDVTGAASYTIEIDDSDQFSSPLVLTQSLTTSQLTTNVLPTKRLWWRVRANPASGLPGPWSSVRRFELR